MSMMSVRAGVAASAPRARAPVAAAGRRAPRACRAAGDNGPAAGYANASWTSASENKVLDAVHADLDKVPGALANAELREFS